MKKKKKKIKYELNLIFWRLQNKKNLSWIKEWKQCLDQG
jgi:hypothetical protein